jgi:hypothetical protein
MRFPVVSTDGVGDDDDDGDDDDGGGEEGTDE